MLHCIHIFRDVVKLPSGKSDKKAEPVKFTIKETATYVSLAKALSVDWSKSENAKKVNKMDYSYFLMRGRQWEVSIKVSSYCLKHPR